MKNPVISIICAIAEENRAIGKNNQLLFDIPEDLARFKKITSGHPVIMGYKTYESLPFLLPKRLNIVLSPEEILIDGAVVAHSLDEAYAVASEHDQDEIFVIGGGFVYSQAIKDADRLYLTLVKSDVSDADTFFPEYSEFTKVIEDSTAQSGDYSLRYLTLERS
jgi:dihydrofolate reductase